MAPWAAAINQALHDGSAGHMDAIQIDQRIGAGFPCSVVMTVTFATAIRSTVCISKR